MAGVTAAIRSARADPPAPPRGAPDRSRSAAAAHPRTGTVRRGTAGTRGRAPRRGRLRPAIAAPLRRDRDGLVHERESEPLRVVAGTRVGRRAEELSHARIWRASAAVVAVRAAALVLALES